VFVSTNLQLYVWISRASNLVDNYTLMSSNKI